MCHSRRRTFADQVFDDDQGLAVFADLKIKTRELQLQRGALRIELHRLAKFMFSFVETTDAQQRFGQMGP